TSRRVEARASRLSPGFRARTKRTRSPGRSGMFRVGWIVIVAQPFASVGCSGALYVHPYGSPSAYTSAPCTDRPFVSETWKRPVTGAARDTIGFGEKLTLSITRRSGSETRATAIDVAG